MILRNYEILGKSQIWAMTQVSVRSTPPRSAFGQNEGPCMTWMSKPGLGKEKSTINVFLLLATIL